MGGIVTINHVGPDPDGPDFSTFWYDRIRDDPVVASYAACALAHLWAGFPEIAKESLKVAAEKAKRDE